MFDDLLEEQDTLVDTSKKDDVEDMFKLLDNKWKNLIIEIEKDKYLRGHIAILLHFADIFEHYNNDPTLSWDNETERIIFDNLSKYFSIYKMFFDG